MNEGKVRRYRPNVAVVVLNHEGKLLACRRNDIPGVWQIPQGGIDNGEEVTNAMYRELQEEIGTSEVTIIGCLPEVIQYDWPPELYSRGYHGQAQYYYLVRLNEPTKINLSSTTTLPEFDAIEWMTRTEFISRLNGFKQDVYTRALELLDRAFPGYILR